MGITRQERRQLVLPRREFEKHYFDCCSNLLRKAQSISGSHWLSLYSHSCPPECSHPGFYFFLGLEPSKLTLTIWVLYACVCAHMHAFVGVSVCTAFPEATPWLVIIQLLVTIQSRAIMLFPISFVPVAHFLLHQ